MLLYSSTAGHVDAADTAVVLFVLLLCWSVMHDMVR